MSKKKTRLNLKFTEKAKDVIKKNSVLNGQLCEDFDTDPYGLWRMLDRNSQSLMHIKVLEAVSQKLNSPIKKIYEEI